MTIAQQMETPAILPRNDGASIAYRALGGSSPTVVFLHGLKSDMTGTKAQALADFCHSRNQAFVRFDCYGHGQSSGRFEEGGIGRWRDDTLAVIDQLTSGPVILVGSSMGGWLMLLVALARRERVAGLVGLAAAPDFTEDLIWAKASAEDKACLAAQGYFDIPNCYGGDPYRISAQFLNEARDHLLLRQEKIAIDCPVRLIHGQRDEDVPYALSLAVADKLISRDVEVIVRKDSDHRLSAPDDLHRLYRAIDELTNKAASV